ncbi:stage II sporulation protein D [Bengtsoniella intestinalis]|uniref:stage II sporulation protein D n=1 Tax=Bengtsoniella intestinalis TaxID=3073143 RepID=UPI00391F3D85
MQTANPKTFLSLWLMLWLGLFFLPAVLVTPWEGALTTTTPTTTPQESEESATIITNTVISDDDITIRVLDGDTVIEMTLGAYLVGVVSAEMPASFHIEALKAQACAARTYTLYQMLNGSVHGDTADICTDFACCQAYVHSETSATDWGAQAAEYESRIRSAVYQTSGETIDYDGSPILAVFHASSAGQTRQAGSVWVSDLPYLQSVDSPESADTVPNYYTEVTYSQSELRQLLLPLDPQIVLGEDFASWLANPITEDGGNVVSVDIGGQSVSGTTVRSALSLRSACFTWSWVGEDCTFSVTGYGHGVGLSQYGANTMASAGATYQDILTHYYTGVTLSTDSVAAMALQ